MASSAQKGRIKTIEVSSLVPSVLRPGSASTALPTRITAAATALAMNVPLMLLSGQAQIAPRSAPTSTLARMLPSGPSGGWYSGMPGSRIRLMSCEVRPNINPSPAPNSSPVSRR